MHVKILHNNCYTSKNNKISMPRNKSSNRYYSLGALAALVGLVGGAGSSSRAACRGRFPPLAAALTGDAAALTGDFVTTVLVTGALPFLKVI